MSPSSISDTSGISVIIPVYNQVHWTKGCLQTLLDHSSEARNLIIVDNHSTDDTPQFLESERERFEAKGWKYTVITNTENKGFGRACNQGIRIATGSYITILNNDTWLMPDWDGALKRAIKRTGAALVGPYYYEKKFHPKKIKSRAKRFVDWNKGKSRPWWVPMLMFFDKKALDQVGIFDERYFVSFEEIDLRVRFDQAGLKYLMVGDCFIWHAVKGTRGDAKIITPQHEIEGRRIFIDKWGFDPDHLRPHYHTWPERLKRRWLRIRNGVGLM